MRFFGLLILSERASLERLYGSEVVAAAVESLPEPVRAEYKSLTPLSWCSARTALAVTEAVAERTGLPQEAVVAAAVRDGVGHLLRGPWRLFVRLNTDEALIKRLALLYSKAYDQSHFTVKLLAPGRAQLSVTGWNDANHINAIAMAAGIEAVFVMAGRKQVTVTWRLVPDGIELTVAADKASLSAAFR